VAERRRRGVLQTAVAHRMGVSQSDVSKLETARYGGRRRHPEPRLSTILRYAAAANIDLAYVQLAFTVVLAAEFAGPAAYEQIVEKLRPLAG
jgi:transcriptional regulator with XRE-family HTH domain